MSAPRPWGAGAVLLVGYPVVASSMAVRAEVSSTMPLPSANAAMSAWMLRLLSARGMPRAVAWIVAIASSLNSRSVRPC